MAKHVIQMVHAGFGARRLPKIKATPIQAERLRSIVDDASIKEGKSAWASSLGELLNRDPVTVAEQAVARLISDKIYSATVPEFRCMVRKREPGELRKSLETLAKLLPKHEQHHGRAFPPWRQMRAVFTGGDPFANDLSHDGDMGKEDEWREKYAPGILLAVVRKHLALMDMLDDLIKGTKPLNVPEHRFVEDLATYWKCTLGLEVKLSRAGAKQTGAFVDFVEAAGSLCPKAIKIGPLSGQIRKHCKR